jgi:hypothetical protein
VGKVDELRALREARYGGRRDSRQAGLPAKRSAGLSRKPVTEGSPVAALVQEGAAVSVPAVVTSNFEVRAGQPIQAYKDGELLAIVAALYSPDVDAERMIDLVCETLGFQRRGKVIKMRVREAFDRVAV